MNKYIKTFEAFVNDNGDLEDFEITPDDKIIHELGYIEHNRKQRSIENIKNNFKKPSTDEKYTSDGNFVIPKTLDFNKVKNLFIRSEYFKNKEEEIQEELNDDSNPLDHNYVILTYLSTWLFTEYFNLDENLYDESVEVFLSQEYDNQVVDYLKILDEIGLDYFDNYEY